jgi:hypothetical protein
VRTKQTIGLIVLSCLVASVAVLGGLVAWLGPVLGIVVGLIIAAAGIGA